MPEIFKPRKYQDEIVNFICEKKRAAVFCFMGAGKTVSTLTALENLNFLEDIYPALIVAPLRVAESTWPEEVKKWEHLKHLRVEKILGKSDERATALRIPAEIYTTNFENLPWLVETVGRHWPFKTVIIDEASKLKGFRTRQGTKRAKALAMVAHTLIKRIVLLTGTPAPNGLKNLWGPLWFIDRGQRLEKSYSAFIEKYFLKSFNGFDVTPRESASKSIEDAIRDVCLTIDARDHFNLEEPIINKIFVELPIKAKKIYRELEKEMFTALETGTNLQVDFAAALSMKCLQLANGAAYTDADKNWEKIHDAKLDALDEIVAESWGENILVSYTFKTDLKRILEKFQDAKVLDKDPKTIEDWNAGKIPMLLAHPASAGHGLNLQFGGRTLVFFGIDWNLENHLQIIERIGPVRQLQAGFKRNVHIHYILAKDTIDELVLERLTTKKTTQEILLEALKTKKEEN